MKGTIAALLLAASAAGAVELSPFWEAHNAPFYLEPHVQYDMSRQGSSAPPATVRPKLPYDCVLKAVLFRMKQEYDPAKPLPDIRFASEVPVEEFDAAMEPQWGFKPGRVTNAYAPHVGTIFLSDNAEYYSKFGRAIDDSLAHEFVHYVQVRYRGLTIEEFTEWDEVEAVQVQNWFREHYVSGTPPDGAPVCGG
jgi:hypothetical protein